MEILHLHSYKAWLRHAPTHPPTPDVPLINDRGAALAGQVGHKEHSGGQVLQACQRQPLHGVAILLGAVQQAGGVCRGRESRQGKVPR